MMWTYESSTGRLLKDGAEIARGYSGNGNGKNNPSWQGVEDTGPIPVGVWRIGPAFNSPTHGPLCLPLLPMPGTETYGRSGFLVHGDSLEHPGEASHGCIIMPHNVRAELVGAGLLSVVEVAPALEVA